MTDLEYGVSLVSTFSAGAYTTTLLVMVDSVNGVGRALSNNHQAGLFLPSLWNVSQKVAIATLRTLWLVCRKEQRMPLKPSAVQNVAKTYQLYA